MASATRRSMRGSFCRSAGSRTEHAASEQDAERPRARDVEGRTALDMVRPARARGVRVCVVGVNSSYGGEAAYYDDLDVREPVFRRRRASRSTHLDEGAWTPCPASKPGRGGPSKQKPATASITVEKLAEGIPPEDWTRCILRDCTRGQLRVDITTRRIGTGTAGKSERDAGI